MSNFLCLLLFILKSLNACKTSIRISERENVTPSPEHFDNSLLDARYQTKILASLYINQRDGVKQIYQNTLHPKLEPYECF